ncbi:MAG: YeeE/YedE family protein [Planktomarina sp.]
MGISTAILINPTDWIYGLIGGLMIGAAASLYLLVSGRIMGASGILGGIVDGSGRDTLMERIAFVAGVIIMPTILVSVMGGGVTNATTNPVLLIIAGLAVGFGTRMANGCTSGHGVCGMSRFSIRGIIATFAYLIFGFATMFIARHVLGVI